MTDIKHIIDPERIGLWVAATFVLALLAFVVALIGLHRINQSAYLTQGEVLILNKKIEGLKAGSHAPAADTAPKAETK